jgi:hypothetical protein
MCGRLQHRNLQERVAKLQAFTISSPGSHLVYIRSMMCQCKWTTEPILETPGTARDSPSPCAHAQMPRSESFFPMLMRAHPMSGTHDARRVTTKCAGPLIYLHRCLWSSVDHCAIVPSRCFRACSSVDLAEMVV